MLYIKEAKKAVKKLKDVHISNTDNFMVLVPDDMNVNLLIASNELKEVTLKLQDINDRILLPIQGWATDVLNASEEDQSMLSLFSVEHSNLDKLIKILKNKHKRSSMDKIYLPNAYRTIAEFESCTDIITDLNVISDNLTTTQLQDSVSKTVRLMSTLSKNNNLDSKRIGKLLRSVAEEIELLGVCLFRISVLTNAHDMNIKKIISKL